MKTLTLSIVFLMVVASCKAQDDYEVYEQNVPYHKLATSFSIDIIGAGESLAIYNWQKFIEKHQGTTYVISYGEGDIELESEHVKLPWLENQLVTIHSRFSPDDTEAGVMMTIWIQMKDESYYSTKTDPNAGKKIKNWLLAFHQDLMALNRTH